MLKALKIAHIKSHPKSHQKAFNTGDPSDNMKKHFIKSSNIPRPVKVFHHNLLQIKFKNQIMKILFKIKLIMEKIIIQHQLFFEVPLQNPESQNAEHLKSRLTQNPTKKISKPKKIISNSHNTEPNIILLKFPRKISLKFFVKNYALRGTKCFFLRGKFSHRQKYTPFVKGKLIHHCIKFGIFS
jgi:hypothetical protein